jgi:hypothetical protein
VYFYLTLLYQDVDGWTALRTGLSWLFMNIPFLVVARSAGRLSRRLPARAITGGGCQTGRINYNLALAIDGSFDHRRISATHLIREAEHWNALGTGEAEQIVTATLADFAKALDKATVPKGVPAPTVAQLAWNVEQLRAGVRSASDRADTVGDAVVLYPKWPPASWSEALLGTHQRTIRSGLRCCGAAPPDFQTDPIRQCMRPRPTHEIRIVARRDPHARCALPPISPAGRR